MLNRLESVRGECALGRGRPCVRSTELTGRRASACKDWSHPSRGVHWSRAGLGRGEWRWHLFWRGGRVRLRAGKRVGVGASRTAAPRSVRRRSRQAGTVLADIQFPRHLPLRFTAVDHQLHCLAFELLSISSGHLTVLHGRIHFTLSSRVRQIGGVSNSNCVFPHQARRFLSLPPNRP